MAHLDPGVPEPAGQRVVLVIDADPAARRSLRTVLRSRSYRVEEATTWASVQAVLERAEPGLVLLDPDLPDADGLGCIQELRAAIRAPLIILSARQSMDFKIQALDSGIDDYLSKPFAVGELLARMRVALRHAEAATRKEHLEFGTLRIDLAGREVTLGSTPVHLSRNEFNLLALLVRNAGQVLSHDQLFHALRENVPDGGSAYVRVYIAALRRKLEPDPAHPRLLLTEQGVGYKFQNGH